MKNKILYIILFALSFSTINAQHINSLYFLENAPMRHTINPAFQPVSKIYIALPMIGSANFSLGINGINMSDLIFTNEKGETITALHPEVAGLLWKKIPNSLNIETDLPINLISFGRRIKDNGYLTIGVSEHIIANVGLPKSIFSPLLGQSIENLDLTTLNASATMYSDIAIGYSHRINKQWTVGGKLKFFIGNAHISGTFSDFEFNSNIDIATLKWRGYLRQAGLTDIRIFTGEKELFPSEEYIYDDQNDNEQNNTVVENKQILDSIKQYILPQGIGGGIDLGFTYKPINQLQIAFSITDLGWIYWNKGSIGSISVDTTFTGVGDFDIANYMVDGQFMTNQFTEDIKTDMEKYADAFHIGEIHDQAFNQMLTANLNVGVDANFWRNRIGIGVYSHTRFFNMQDHLRVTEEITLGATLRPANWFNLALTYSLMNSHWNNVGAAISLAPYDGVMITIAADYIPLLYADYSINENTIIPLPYKTNQLNCSLGLAIVIGTNLKKNKDSK